MNKLIDINGNILVLSDEKIKEGDWYYNSDSFSESKTHLCGRDASVEMVKNNDGLFKIISSSQPLEGVKPLLNSRIELLQMMREKEIERLAEKIQYSDLCDHEDESGQFWRGDSVARLLIQAINAGAKLSSFTEADMIGFAEWIDKSSLFILDETNETKWKSLDEEQFYSSTKELLNLYLSSLPIPTIEVTIEEVDGGVKVKSITN